MIKVYGKDSTPVNYFQQINDEYLTTTDDDGLIPEAVERREMETARFHLEEFIKTFWDPDVRTDFAQQDHLKRSISQDIAALESQHQTLNTGTLSSSLTTTKELMASRFGTHSTKYRDFAELNELYKKEYEAERTSPRKETIKHDYFLRGRQRILAVINQLKSELEQMNTTPNEVKTEIKQKHGMFSNITGQAWTIIITLFIAGVGGAYLLGKDIGSKKFDEKKIDLEKENEGLKNKIQSADKTILDLRDSLKMANDTTQK